MRESMRRPVINIEFVNLAVRDLKKSMAFFSSLGFGFNPKFTDDNAACMVAAMKGSSCC